MGKLVLRALRGGGGAMDSINLQSRLLTSWLAMGQEMKGNVYNGTGMAKITDRHYEPSLLSYSINNGKKNALPIVVH